MIELPPKQQQQQSPNAQDSLEDEQEWVFSIQVPSTAAAEPGLLQLRQRQPSDQRRSNAKHSDSTVPNSSQEDDESSGEGSADSTKPQEKVSLLRADKTASKDAARASSPRRTSDKVTSPDPLLSSSAPETGGWTFDSPFWHLQGQSLLTVTFFPAWQALNEYTNFCTNAFCTFCRRRNLAHSQCCACVASRYNRVEYMAQTYTARDIVKISRIEEMTVEGISGSCRALVLELKPLDTETLSSMSTVPDYLQEAWDSQLRRIQTSREADDSLNPCTSESTESKKDKVGGPVLTFCLPKSQTDHPLLWKVDFPMCGDLPIAIETLTVLDGTLLTDSHIQGKSLQQPEPTHIYINGYQSWSFAGSIPRGHKQPQPALPDAFSRAFNYGGSVPPPADIVTDYMSTFHGGKGHVPMVVQYQSDFFTCITCDTQVPEKVLQTFVKRKSRTPYQQLDETGGPALLLGWLSQRRQFGVITSDKDLRRFQMHASCHGQLLIPGVTRDSISTDWAYAQLVAPHSYDEEPMVHYLHAVASANNARPIGHNSTLLTGWCSWYFAYENISSKLLRDNFSKLAGLHLHVPTNVAVVDDGYMTAWGDWDSVKPKQFPDGMGVVSKNISDKGMRPGLWMAPFAADKHSQLTKDHPDWVIRNDSGGPANSSNCGKFFYGLDATNPEVRSYVHHCVRRAVEDWGFNVLKIDFLYAACLEGNGKYDLSTSRAEAMHLALQTIRDAAGPDTFLIGCGCPISSGVGFVDAMRVSADTGPTWYPAAPLPWWDMGTLPSLRSMVRNSVSRAPFGHRWWHNDPDCLMFGEHTRLSNDEVASAASIVAMTCGMLLLSDDLPKVPPARMTILSKIFPLTGVSATVLDLHSTNTGLPSLLRLWCTDKYKRLEQIRTQLSFEDSFDEGDHNAEATLFARAASFRLGEEPPVPSERERSCIHVASGLGTWTVVSVSNWLDRSDVVSIPPPALLPAPTTGWSNQSSARDSIYPAGKSRDFGEHGYHVFAFWSSRYSWLPSDNHDNGGEAEHTIHKKLAPHATEIFHIKPVTPDKPQYIGSDLHFSCGRELRAFQASPNSLRLILNSELKRAGRIFVFVPRTNVDHVRVNVNGKQGRWSVVGNTPNVNENGSPRLVGRVISIAVSVKADKSQKDGSVAIDF